MREILDQKSIEILQVQHLDLEDRVESSRTAKMLPTLSTQISQQVLPSLAWYKPVLVVSINPTPRSSTQLAVPEDWSSTSGQKSLMMVALLGLSAGVELQLMDTYG